ncbi:putative oxidoreductase/Short-chain dehydrogenase [Labilithrix luteola]|uniref:Putative oxidoreductase/Short-chain dehydrogenase n=1 Tax=Labilithrix luteola TaxID=1391654 RepID=A0A0K1QGC8_9BACT|nr:SDR family NAD(P)-dependent oxidoreductase [Labilithrix luteola]AKV04495.1 putative oxidoreductase/Short-chain dehydrogenase [Labilithrix luteola]
MPDLVLTGATRGIGHALALALANRRDGTRLLLAARDEARLEALAGECSRVGTDAVAVPGDLGTLASARDLGERLAKLVRPGATLVHIAGLWPSSREFGPDGFERAFVVNHLGGLTMQAPLLEAGLLRRVMVVSAGLLVKGRFDATRTPTGDDFSAIRTYCTTKLCFAVAMRDVAAAHPDVDVVVLHPGVVRTDLGARKGPLGWLLSLVKRSWESPETCAARLVRILDRPRWSQPGQAKWLVEEEEQSWPPVTEDPATVAAIRRVTAASLKTEELA